MARTMILSLAAAAVFAIAAGTTAPADAAKRDKATTGGHASTSDSVDLTYVAGHGSPSAIKARPRRPRTR